MKKVLAFDLDGTLADSKSNIEGVIAKTLANLLGKFQVCVISGCKFEQFKKQVIDQLKVTPEKLEALHIMATCGTRYYHFNKTKSRWDLVYAKDLTGAQKKKIIDVLNKVIVQLGYKESKTWGETIEDRGSQITFSALGQDVVEALGAEGVKKKEDWDSDNKKKEAIAKEASKLMPEFEVRVGGLTSIDVTLPGIDKAYGMTQLIEYLGVTKKEILFFGDRLVKGGNDYPVRAMGIDAIEVNHWRDTVKLLQTITYLISP